MGKPRSRVIQAAANDSSGRVPPGGSASLTATVWIRRHRENGESVARRQGKPRSSAGSARDLHPALVDETKYITLADIAARLDAEQAFALA